MTEDHPEAEREYAKRCAAELIEVVVKSSRYVINFAPKEVELADFRMEVSDYRNQVGNCRNEATLVHELIDRGILST